MSECGAKAVLPLFFSPKTRCVCPPFPPTTRTEYPGLDYIQTCYRTFGGESRKVDLEGKRENSLPLYCSWKGQRELFDMVVERQLGGVKKCLEEYEERRRCVYTPENDNNNTLNKLSRQNPYQLITQGCPLSGRTLCPEGPR